MSPATGQSLTAARPGADVALGGFGGFFDLKAAGYSDPLLVAAAYHMDNLACPAGTGLREQPLSRQAGPRARYSGADGGERTGMSAR